MDTNSAGGEEPKLPPETAPASIGVSLRGFSDKASAERFGNVIGSAVRQISRIIDLERLDGITVAFDYDEALAQLDRGFKPSRPLTRTGTDQLIGVAMTPAVLRDGVVKSHMVFHASVALAVEDVNSEGFLQALYLVAHECGHVEDLKFRDEAFPGTILQQPITDQEDAILGQISSACWDEYAACRLSAIFGKQQQTAIYEQSFISVLGVAYDRANEAIRSFRSHQDINRLLGEGAPPLCEPLRTAAYLSGHLDGLNADFDQAPMARDHLAGSRYASFVQRLRDALRDLWSRRGHWATPAEFDVLKNIGRDVLASGGIILRRLPAGLLYVDVPYTPETMPP